MKILGVLLCCSAFSVCLSGATKLKFKDCGSQVGKLVSIDFSPCPRDPCTIKRGSNVTGTITFIPNEEVTSAKVVVIAIFGLFPFPLPLPNSDGCKGFGLKCPLEKDQQYELSFSYYVATTFPAGKVKLKGELKDQGQHMIFCYVVPITLL